MIHLVSYIFRLLVAATFGFAIYLLGAIASVLIWNGEIWDHVNEIFAEIMNFNDD